MVSALERYQRIAPLYDALDLPFEYGRYRHIRPLLFKDLSGSILDAGVGTGRNIPFYPASANVVGIDLSPAMLTRADRRARKAGRAVDLRLMDVTDLKLPGRSFDAAVASFLFCVLPEEQQEPALREIARVLKTGGTLRLLEYAPDGRSEGVGRAPVGALDGLGVWCWVRPHDRAPCTGAWSRGPGSALRG